ncbi:ribonuclease P protein component [uncultured Roseobacter sp.]|uniref:ribonuclease P protein component n=1 Tax=uncultured Roseobacter sp. TaxID=114847 RepID=UPI00262470F9|nr:ribonuclease P protein component [uncultured Roseobacter sp.]
MTPPQASPPGTTASGDLLPAVSLRLETLRKRADFQRAARARRIAMPGFILQMRKRPDGDAQGIRVGYTCSKKVGNAVARNRAKRRLREAARLVLTHQGRDGMDYVLIGRREHTTALPFDKLRADLETALRKLHGPAR